MFATYIAGSLRHVHTFATMHITTPKIWDRKAVASARKGIPPENVVRDAVDVFKAFANPTRVRIMHALAHNEMCVGDLAHVLALRMSTLSHQLAVLRQLKLITARDDGRQTFYSCADHFISELVHSCLAHVERGNTTSAHAHKHPHRRRR